MKRLSSVLLLVIFFLSSTTEFLGAQVRVACVGNSITYGAGIANRNRDSYPAQLQRYLGPKYKVQNFGVNGTTLLSRGDYPYVRTREYQQSLAFQPDIVFIKLGTNDSKPQNRIYLDEYKSDYLKLIKAYRALSTHPRIILLQPVHCYLPEPNTISDSVLQHRITPVIRDIAYEENLETVDLYRMFGDTCNLRLFPDRLHPSAVGAGMMAKRLADYLLRPALPSANVTLPLSQRSVFNFYGYKGVKYDMNGVTCYLVAPRRAAKGNPWIWRARFWGHQPQTDISLLEHGFYLAYCDVADLFGAPKAVKRWNDFYHVAVGAGLAKKAALEGMSRGGLIIYNFAAAYPNRVAAIYADAPVLDIKSWPMGKGASAGSPNDVKMMLAAYGFHSEQEALDWKGNPVDKVAVFAKSKIALLHVVGDADKTVPVKENTTVFEKRYNRYGKTLRVIHKPGVDHHPHSLFNPEPIVSFLLQATVNK
jgi:lysophospholipase L1-like esterase